MRTNPDRAGISACSLLWVCHTVEKVWLRFNAAWWFLSWRASAGDETFLMLSVDVHVVGLAMAILRMF